MVKVLVCIPPPLLSYFSFLRWRGFLQCLRVTLKQKSSFFFAKEKKGKTRRAAKQIEKNGRRKGRKKRNTVRKKEKFFRRKLWKQKKINKINPSAASPPLALSFLAKEKNLQHAKL